VKSEREEEEEKNPRKWICWHETEK